MNNQRTPDRGTDMSMLPADTHRRLFTAPPGLPNVWFMYDNHSFASVDTTVRSVAFARIKALFEEDGCGMISTKWPSGQRRPQHPKKALIGRYRAIGYGVSDDEINNWLDEYYAAPVEGG